MGGWINRLRATLGGGGTPRGEVYAGLRSMALTLDPASLDLPSGQPWSAALVAMMEIGTSSGTATFVAIADGTVSMYTSTGGGVIGAGEHAAVRAAADRFRVAAAEARGQLESTTEFPGPAPGEVCFQLRTEDAGYTGHAPERALAAGRHPLSALFAAGQDLVTEIRLSSPS